MDLSWDGFEDLVSGGVLNPATIRAVYKENMSKYKKLNDRVYLLYEPPSSSGRETGQSVPATTEPDFDIVLLHGIGSDEFSCWCNENDIIWPAVFIPQDFPAARIITVGYAHSLWNWKQEHTDKEDGDSSTGRGREAVGDGKGIQEAGAPSKMEEWGTLVNKIGSGLKSWWSSESTPEKVIPTTKKENTSVHRTEADESPIEPTPSSVPTPPQTKTLVFDAILAASAVDDDDDADKSTTGDNAKYLKSVEFVAAGVAERLLSPEVGIGRRPVVFVAHSMGGLVTKQMLVSLFHLMKMEQGTSALTSNPPLHGEQLQRGSDNETPGQRARRLLSATRGVVFYATPHFGSGLASVITGMKRYYGSLGGLSPTHVVSGLGDHNRQRLVRLNDMFFEVIDRMAECEPPALPPRDETSAATASTDAAESFLEELRWNDQAGDTLSQSSSAGSSAVASGNGEPNAIHVLSFGETRKLGGLVMVVEPESANPIPDDPRYPFFLLDGDHSEINRPGTKIKPGYSILHGFLSRLQQRGVLGRKRSAHHALPPATSVAVAKPEEAPRTAQQSLRVLADSYETEWSALTRSVFDSASPSLRAPRWHQVALALRKTRLLLDELDGALREFFGHFVPSELDAIFYLGEDMLSFVQAEVASSQLSSRSTTVLTAQLEVPLALLSHWAHAATELLRTMEVTHAEKELSSARTVLSEGASSDTTLSVLQRHLSSKDAALLQLIEKEVRLLRGEWEVLRRYIVTDAAEEGQISQLISQQFPSLSPHQLQMLFFARCIRSVASLRIGDDGCLFNLLAYYFNTTVEQTTMMLSIVGETVVRVDFLSTENYVANQKRLLSQENPFTVLIAEGLDLFPSTATASATSESRSVFLTAVTPVLQSAACFLQGCYDIARDDSASAVPSHDRGRLRRRASDLFQQTLTHIRRGRDEQTKRRRAAMRALERDRSGSLWPWWGSSESSKDMAETLRSKQLHHEILSAAFELVVAGFAVLSTLPTHARGDTLIGTASLPHTSRGGHTSDTASPSGHPAPPPTTLSLQQTVQWAYQAYGNGERGLRGELVEKDADKPFAEAFSDAINPDALAEKLMAVRQADDLGAVTEEARKQLRDAFAVVMEEINTNSSAAAAAEGATERAKSAAGKDMKKKHGASSFALKKEASSFVDSVLRLWTTIRKGDDTGETPEYFAHTAMVFWWIVEEQVLMSRATCASLAKVSADAAQIECAATLVAQQCRNPFRHPGPEQSVAPSLPASPQQVQQHQQQAHHLARCQPTLRGQWALIEVIHHFSSTVVEQYQVATQDLEGLLSNSTATPADAELPGQKRPETQSGGARSAATHLTGDVHRSVGQARELDKDGAAANWVGGNIALLQHHGSPDAARCFLRVLAEERSPRSTLHRAASTALGWVHLHQLRLGAGNTPLALNSAAVVDAVADERAPAGLGDFSSRAAALRGRYREECARLLPHDPRWGAGADVPSRQHVAAAAGRQLQLVALAGRHFERVLSVDPADVGALCGLGRIKLLSLSREAIADAPPQSKRNAGVLKVPDIGTAARLFAAAVDASRAAPAVAAADTALRAEELLHANRYCSYAAYWMGELVSGGYVRGVGAATATVGGLDWFETALRLNPTNDWAMTSLARCYLSPLPSPSSVRQASPSSPADRQRGARLVERALALNPHNQWALWLGSTAAGSGNTKQQEWCRRALRTALFRGRQL